MRGLVLCVPLVGLLAPQDPEPRPTRTTVAQGVLTPATPIRKQLKAGEVHEYVVPLAAGQAVKIAAAQVGIDVKIELVDPGGTSLSGVNDGVQVGGSEILAWVTQTEGDHRIKVWTENSSAEPGDYELLAEAAVATETHVAAITAYNEGRGIFERASRATDNQRAQMTEALGA